MAFFRRKSNQEPGLVEVYVTAGLLQAEIIKGKLESNDIPTLLKYESLGPVMGLTVDGLGQVQILVPAEHAELARTLLEVTDVPLDDVSEADATDEPWNDASEGELT